MNNNDIRNEAASAGVRLWRIAERLGINDGNFSRLLRKDLTAERREEIKAIIAELKTAECENGGKA